MADLTASLECSVRVVRVETAPDGDSYGIGCKIEDYRFLDEGDSRHSTN